MVPPHPNMKRQSEYTKLEKHTQNGCLKFTAVNIKHFVRVKECTKQRVNKIAAAGWVRGCDQAAVVCGLRRLICIPGQRLPVGDPFSPPSPQKGALPSALKILCLRPPIRTYRNEHRSVILTQRGHKVVFSLRIKPGKPKNGAFYLQEILKGSRLELQAGLMNEVVTECAACGLGAPLSSPLSAWSTLHQNA